MQRVPFPAFLCGLPSQTTAPVVNGTDLLSTALAMASATTGSLYPGLHLGASHTQGSPWVWLDGSNATNLNLNLRAGASALPGGGAMLATLVSQYVLQWGLGVALLVVVAQLVGSQACLALSTLAPSDLRSPPWQS